MPTDAGRKSSPTGAVVAVLCLAGTTVSLQQTLVVALLPSFAELLSLSTDDVSWLITATLLTSAVATPVVARLADMYGKRLMMIVCIVLMAAGSLIAALSSGSFALLIVGRALQGFSSALIPVGISIMRDQLPKEKVSSAIALMSATLGIGGALGLPLGGLLFSHFGWSAVFWLSVVVGIAILVAVIRIVPESGVRTRGRFDLVGALLLSAALTCLLLVISKGAQWHGEVVIALLVAAVAILAVWFPYSLRASQPLVDLRTSARRPVLLTNLASVLVGFALMANILLTAQQLQLPPVAGGYGLDALSAGLAMVPGGLAMVVFSPVSGRMINRWGGRITLLTGCAIMGAAYLGWAFFGHSMLAVVTGSTIVMVGCAIAYAAMPSLIMANVPITETASANGLNSLLRALGTSTASAVIAALLAGVTHEVDGVQVTSPLAYTITCWIGLAVCLAAGVLVWLVPRDAAAPLEADVEAAPAPRKAAVAQAGESSEIVVRGRVLRPDDKPHPQAVVTAVRLTGEPLDWARADNAGAFSLALPGRGRYLLIANADAWTPKSQVADFQDPDTPMIVHLGGPLLLTGTVTQAGAPVQGALLTLSATTGEVRATTASGADGSYLLRLPPPGHQILTVLGPDLRATRAVKIFTTTQSAICDIELEPSGSTADES
ncbi:major facilitator superfamily transporter [Microlunatus phosphovorus NM-1]|uniref:Major facilitator superfamily transporter n=1 Tax=Microlunatus phosphovorus (strain ATCC 700054 / DSM 10555 / JCM 9379 / NBRC 101784 / NCIMB 13414 / VKM Ac-1990 / NM-1) TaxID=1032480 RepID=F5XHQ0_MICPN|nr:MFS transporter [Microlunatus phosphovorus]BAK33195.1 major facilitator superfamily transporter [Microlunatus phosphovorus NM-1]